jgi:hypothetical protein
LQADGKLWVGGTFTNFMDMPRGRLARITNSAPVFEQLSYTAAGVTWSRSGPLPELRETLFETSATGANWTSVGIGTHTASGWVLPAVNIPANYQLRGVGYVTGCDSVSSWHVQSSVQVPSTKVPEILMNDGLFGFQGNHFGFTVAKGVGDKVIVQGSTNLVNWANLSTNATGSGTFYFSDSFYTSYPKRYYRAKVQ